MPNQPGSRIMRSIIPFIAVVVAGFAVLGLFIAALYAPHGGRPSPPAKTGCAIWPCTIRSADCRTAISSANGWKRSSTKCGSGGAAGRDFLHRPRPLQGRQRHARPSGRRRVDPQRHAAARRIDTRRGHGGAAGRRRIRGYHLFGAGPCVAAGASPDASSPVSRGPIDQRAYTSYRRQHRHRGDRPAHAETRPTSCATPISRSIGRRTKAASAPVSMTWRWTRICPSRKLMEADLRDAIENGGLCWRISRWSTIAAKRSSASKRWRAGTIPSTATSGRPNSFPSPRTSASSPRWANGCCGAPASTEKIGPTSPSPSTSRRCNSAVPTSSRWSNGFWPRRSSTPHAWNWKSPKAPSSATSRPPRRRCGN